MANFQWERLLDGARRRRWHAGDFRADTRLREGAQGLRPPDRQFQAIRHKLAEMATLIEASRDFNYHCLRLFLDGQDA